MRDRLRTGITISKGASDLPGGRTGSGRGERNCRDREADEPGTKSAQRARPRLPKLPEGEEQPTASLLRETLVSEDGCKLGTMSIEWTGAGATRLGCQLSGAVLLDPLHLCMSEPL